MNKNIDVFEQILRIYEERGNERYMIEEPITQIQHAIQTALQIKVMGGSPELQVAGLLHDIGHLVQNHDPLNPSDGKDDEHERIGANWLAMKGFKASVYEPIRWHVDAKRYLCAVKPEYMNELTPASQLSLKLQGGPMDKDEQKVFENRQSYREAVMLRSADDRGKAIDVADLPEFSSFRALVLSALKSK